MLPTILIHPDNTIREQEAEKILAQNQFHHNHPDLLWLDHGAKLGVEQVKQIREFLAIKPYQHIGHAVVLISADNLTTEAQNALLKTLEEPPINTVIVLGSTHPDKLLPTVLSRCRLIQIDCTSSQEILSNEQLSIADRLLKQTCQERFQYIEKLEDKEALLYILSVYFHNKLQTIPNGSVLNFNKDLLQAQIWIKQNINPRAILEYLMLKMPKEK